MRIFDKYIIKHIASTYIFILLVFIGLYFVIDILTNLSDLLKSKPPLHMLGLYYLNSLPVIIRRVSPLAVIVATLYTFGGLNKNNEIVSLRASGVSISRISLPVLFFAVLISSGTLFLQEKILIRAQKKVDDITSQYIKKDANPVSEERNLVFTSGNMIFFAERFLPKDGLLKNVIIFEENKEGEIKKKIICKDIVYEYGFWIGKDVIEYELDEQGNASVMPTILGTRKIGLEDKPRELIFKKSIYSEFSSLYSLRKKINSLKKVNAGKQRANLIVDYYRKMAESFEPFFLVIGLLPLALEIKKKKVALSSLGIGLIFYFLYYTAFYFSIALGKSGLILPFFSAWMAPIFFLSVGISGLFLIR